MTTLEKIILRCKEADPCQLELERLVACQSLNEAWVVLIKNMWWVFSNNILEIEDWRELLDAGVDCTANYNCAICKASENGNLDVVKLLLKHGANCTANGNYAIRRASYFRHTQIVELLKQHGAKL